MTELSHSAYEDRLRLPPSCSSDYHSAEYDQGVFAVAADKSRKYIVENGSFNSPKDQEIALEVIGKLEQRLQLRYYGLTPDAYHAALTSLQALVPVTNEKGLREINGRAISPALERRIASRIESPEIDTAGPEGAWGRLPEAVKRHTTYYGSEIMLELGTNCTVGCSFCGLADKGPIGAKMSFDSATEIISYFSDKQMLNPNKLRQDCLYYGTDCFDIKWAASESGDKPERDYTDLVKAYNKITQDKYRDVGTSTAVPIGEELRVINFAIQSLSSNKHNRLRLSVARSNAERVTHIKTILQAVAPDKFKDLVTNDVDVAMRGNGWSAPKLDFNTWDVLGPDCRDGVIVGPQEIYRIAVEGASPERPNAGQRVPLATRLATATRYSIPRPYTKPDFSGYVHPAQMYPPTIVDHLDIDDSGEVLVNTETQHDNPHRALARLAAAAGYYPSRSDGTVAPEAQAQFVQHFTPAVETVWKHLEAGANNAGMHAILKLLVNKGLLPKIPS